MVLDDPHTAIAPLLHRSHVTGGIARARKRVGARLHIRAVHFFKQCLRLLLPHEHEQFLRRRRAEEFLCRIEHVERQRIARNRKQLVRPSSEAVDHARAARVAVARLAARVEQPALFQVGAEILDSHVRHAEVVRDFLHTQALRALEQVQHAEARGTGDGCDEFLRHRRKRCALVAWASSVRC